MPRARYKFQRLVFNPANLILIYFSEKLQNLAEDAFGDAAQLVIEQFIYGENPHT